ncbi:uncharacterized protein AMSG_12070 [Thecamonas trahens ATCC 50062]|uniref:Uncharacterized protein n=1 Tax=Thecamonas trahens ATCC 50062 TaxID=461836 RepID=A0A0L0DG95_THETB|nr:hypothetical protein AMSG_12070 [Thecamonas trahens ATCC 50062]KNC51357.1 hypothetical protein AMSG_12070 [Thecamonas trahens ATCC 50062]|eukprot:XP_013756309.1 hypothetical protein AMSG_12070 [Thecamonas trahens ATCC 50062]
MMMLGLGRRRHGELTTRDWLISGAAGAWGLTFFILAVAYTSAPSGQRHTALGLGIVLLLIAVGRLMAIKIFAALADDTHAAATPPLLANAPARAAPISVAHPEAPPAYTPPPGRVAKFG